jgi:hypothetical protein
MKSYSDDFPKMRARFRGLIVSFLFLTCGIVSVWVASGPLVGLVLWLSLAGTLVGTLIHYVDYYRSCKEYERERDRLRDLIHGSGKSRHAG